MEDKNKKYNNKAIVGTIVFHAALLVVFFLFGLTTPLPLPEEEGVEINLGFTDQGHGTRQTLTSAPPPPQPQPQPATTAPAPNVATQSSEESVAIPTSRDERPRPQPQTTTPQPQTTTPQQTTTEPPPPAQPQVDQRALFPGRDRQTTATQEQGTTGQPGNQGQPDGSPTGTASAGGGSGGVEFSLTGRRANHLPLPEYTTASQGRVVVSITVNRNGEVIRAVAGARGTTTSDRILWAAAESAAMRARFDIKSDAAHEQTGTITYNFIRLN